MTKTKQTHNKEKTKTKTKTMPYSDRVASLQCQPLHDFQDGPLIRSKIIFGPLNKVENICYGCVEVKGN